MLRFALPHLWHAYVDVVRWPGVARPAAGVGLASLPIGVLGLAMLLLMRDSTGSFSAAGLVVGALTLGTGLGIWLQGRLMDRFGLTRVLVPAALTQVPALMVFVRAASADLPVWLLAVTAFVAGSCEPQVGGAMRALWTDLIPARLQSTGMAWSSVLFEVPMVTGPLLLVPVLAVAGPATAVLGCGGCFLSGTLLLATSRAARRRRGGPAAAAGLLGALAHPLVRLVLLAAAVAGAVTGLLQVFMTVLVDGSSTAAWLFAALSAGSLTGTVAYGARPWHGPPLRRVATMLGLLTLVIPASLLSSAPPVLAVVMFTCGLVLGPLTVACYSTAGEHAPPGTEVGGFTALTAAALAASSAGTAAGGTISEATRPEAVLLIACSVAVAGMAILLSARRRPNP